MFGQAFEVIVPDNWHDVDGIGLRLIEMQDDTVANRCNTGAFYSGYESMCFCGGVLCAEKLCGGGRKPGDNTRNRPSNEA